MERKDKKEPLSRSKRVNNMQASEKQQLADLEVENTFKPRNMKDKRDPIPDTKRCVLKISPPGSSRKCLLHRPDDSQQNENLQRRRQLAKSPHNASDSLKLTKAKVQGGPAPVPYTNRNPKEPIKNLPKSNTPHKPIPRQQVNTPPEENKLSDLELEVENPFKPRTIKVQRDPVPDSKCILPQDKTPSPIVRPMRKPIHHHQVEMQPEENTLANLNLQVEDPFKPKTTNVQCDLKLKMADQSEPGTARVQSDLDLQAEDPFRPRTTKVQRKPVPDNKCILPQDKTPSPIIRPMRKPAHRQQVDIQPEENELSDLKLPLEDPFNPRTSRLQRDLELQMDDQSEPKAGRLQRDRDLQVENLVRVQRHLNLQKEDPFKPKTARVQRDLEQQSDPIPDNKCILPQDRQPSPIVRPMRRPVHRQQIEMQPEEKKLLDLNQQLEDPFDPRASRLQRDLELQMEDQCKPRTARVQRGPIPDKKCILPQEKQHSPIARPMRKAFHKQEDDNRQHRSIPEQQYSRSKENPQFNRQPIPGDHKLQSHFADQRMPDTPLSEAHIQRSLTEDSMQEPRQLEEQRLPEETVENPMPKRCRLDLQAECMQYSPIQEESTRLPQQTGYVRAVAVAGAAIAATVVAQERQAAANDVASRQAHHWRMPTFNSPQIDQCRRNMNTTLLNAALDIVRGMDPEYLEQLCHAIQDQVSRSD